MKQIDLILIILIGSMLSACSTINNPQEKFSHFRHVASFDIAKVSHYNIAILGLIDDTKSLTAYEKEQFTYAVYQSFVNEVEEDNLISTEDLVADISVEKYQQVVAAAKVNDTNKISQLMSESSEQSGRYLLVSRLTDSRDLNKDSYYDNNNFFSDNSCSTSGWAIGLTMTIIDTQNGSEVWGGHLNKKNKQQYCNDDDEFFTVHRGDRQDHHDDESLLATVLVVAAVGIIVNEMTDEDESSATNNEQLSIFKEAVHDFSEQLPSFFR